MKIKSLSREEENKDDLRYIHFGITPNGMYRCGYDEDKYGKPCCFTLYKHLSSLARHYQKHHLD